MNPSRSDSEALFLAKRVRLTPWRGPLHFFLLLATVSVSLLLPVAYGLLMLAFGCSMAWDAVLWIRHLANAQIYEWADFLPLTVLSAGGVTWLFMLRPLMTRSPKAESSVRLTAASQPRLFALVEEICWHLRLSTPEEIRVNAGRAIHYHMRDGLAGVLRDQGTRLDLGLSLMTAMKAPEFTALLVREFAMATGGAGVVLGHLLHELNRWFQSALSRCDPWESELAAKPPQEKGPRAALRLITGAWMWAAMLPFALFAITFQIVCAAALIRLQKGADFAAQNVLGKTNWQQLQGRLRRVESLWEACSHEVNRGVILKRLPENLPLLVARKAECEKFRSPVTEPLHPPTSASLFSEQAARGAFLVREMSEHEPASVLLRNFIDLSRQATCFHYQHELGLDLQEHQLVAHEEILHAGHAEEATLSKIRRYFGGLAHPERAICGLGGAPAAEAGEEELRSAIRQGREEIKTYGGRMKVTLQEWNQSWLRRRDLEAGALLSTTGFADFRLQFGNQGNSPAALREEAGRQRMLMENMESALCASEVKMERRFASALRMLWRAAPGDLPNECLRTLQAGLPGWATVYETLARALPTFRELLTLCFAFRALGSRHTSVEDSMSHFHALQSVVPTMIQLARQIADQVGETPYPATAQGSGLLLKEHLFKGNLPAQLTISMDLTSAADVRALASRMAADASDIIAPFTDRFLKHYHEVFAWLAEAAELSENHFIGPMNLGSVTEILLPEEFARQQESRPTRQRAVAVPVPVR